MPALFVLIAFLGITVGAPSVLTHAGETQAQLSVTSVTTNVSAASSVEFHHRAPPRTTLTPAWLNKSTGIKARQGPSTTGAILKEYRATSQSCNATTRSEWAGQPPSGAFTWARLYVPVSRLEDILKQPYVWAVVFPDGRVHARFMYDTRKTLKSIAPGEIYGDCSTWERAKRDGHRAKKLYLSETPGK